MRKFQLWILLLVTPAILLQLSCKKELSLAESNNSQAYFDNWRLSVNTSSPNRIERLSQLSQTSQFSQATFAKNEEGETLTIIPLSSKLTTEIKRLQDYQHYLVITFDRNNNYRANLVLYKPLNSYSKFHASAIARASDASEINDDGIYAFTTVFDKYLFERKYEKGRLSKFAELRKNIKGNMTLPRDGQVCTDWWLVTTTYYADGHEEVSYEFLYTVCTDCQPNELCDELVGGGGGGNPIEEEYAVAKEIGWSIQHIDLYYHVWSTERLKGKRNSSEPQGGHFTGIVHLGSSLTKPGWTWNNDFRQASASGQTASAQMKGHIYGPQGQHYFANKTETWSFSSVF